MRTSTLVIYGVSFALHAALALGMSGVRPRAAEPRRVVVTTVLPEPAREPEPTPEVEPEPEPAPVDDAPALDAPPPDPTPAPPRPSRPSTPAPAAAAPTAAASPGVLDTGLTLGGMPVATGDGTGGGVAGPTPSPRTREAGPRRLEAPEPQRARPRGGCDEEPTRPRPLTLPRPSYTEAARAAGIEGRVRLRVHIGADGEIARVEVLDGLGHGLDEAAVDSVRTARFEAGTACGRGVETNVVLSIRFTR